MDYSLSGSSVHGDFLGKNTGMGCHALLQEIFPIQGLNLCHLNISCIGKQVLTSTWEVLKHVWASLIKRGLLHQGEV